MALDFQRGVSWRDFLRAQLNGLMLGLLVGRLWPHDLSAWRPVAALGTSIFVSTFTYLLTVRSPRPVADRVRFGMLISIAGTVLYGLIVWLT